MNTLTQQRTELVSLLTGAGLQAVSYLPARPNPPVAIVSPNQPWLEQGAQFGQYRSKFTVLLLTRTADNEVVTEQLDAMAVQVAVALAEGRFTLRGVDQPQSFQVGSAAYLGATCDVTVDDWLEVGE